ncbi:MAG: hypothetical protein OXN89_06925 [Bryobacterales bacterium]|nr:hypothetical protein [Bryobacterales bacterium]
MPPKRDINNFANDLLLVFCDAVHAELERVLANKFGADWLRKGVRPHFHPDYFDRTQKMLTSPMRAIDMERRDDELFGIEHLWNIVAGNWDLFRGSFDDRTRTQAYFQEVSELRHNLAHRRTRHVLLRSNLIRVMGGCQLLLSALESPQADHFAEVVDSLSSGGTPWGPVLAGHLPPSHEMYGDFVGRPSQLAGLSEWLASDNPQTLVWGYGGAGKSALAYKFAQDIRDGSSDALIAVCWATAKSTEYSEEGTRERVPDFIDLDTFCAALWKSLYGPLPSSEVLTTTGLLKDLREMPILLVVDDFDTISEDVDLTNFLLHELKNTPTRVIYTSRYRVPSIPNIEVPPFSDDELKEFVLQRLVDYEVTETEYLERLDAITKVTGGYPLFVADFIRHSAFVGVRTALKDWGQKKGDAARQYALQRQIEYLSHSTAEVLIALAVARQGLNAEQIGEVAGLTDDDAATGIGELLRWRMANQVTTDDDRPVFRMNGNTIRLVEQTFKGDWRLGTYATAFKTLTGERVPEAKRAAIGRVVDRAKRLSKDSFEEAERCLQDAMKGELRDSADLAGVLGWLYSNQTPFHAPKAREAFEKSHRFGSTKVDTYYHWAEMERKLGEELTEIAQHGQVGEVPEETVIEQWKYCEDVALKGLDRCGASQPLFYLAGYAASRVAKASARANKFTYAESAWERAIEDFRNALSAPFSELVSVSKSVIYRGLTLAHEGTGNQKELGRSLKSWHAVAGSSPNFQGDCRRLLSKFPNLRKELPIDVL